MNFVPDMQDACVIVAQKELSCCELSAETSAREYSSEDGDTEAPMDCTENPDCNTCPVCYTFICPATYEMAAQHIVVKKNFVYLSSSYRSAYTCRVWKPPNAFHISA